MVDKSAFPPTHSRLSALKRKLDLAELDQFETTAEIGRAKRLSTSPLVLSSLSSPLDSSAESDSTASSLDSSVPVFADVSPKPLPKARRLPRPAPKNTLGIQENRLMASTVDEMPAASAETETEKAVVGVTPVCSRTPTSMPSQLAVRTKILAEDEPPVPPIPKLPSVASLLRELPAPPSELRGLPPLLSSSVGQQCQQPRQPQLPSLPPATRELASPTIAPAEALQQSDIPSSTSEAEEPTLTTLALTPSEEQPTSAPAAVVGSANSSPTATSGSVGLEGQLNKVHEVPPSSHNRADFRTLALASDATNDGDTASETTANSRSTISEIQSVPTSVRSDDEEEWYDGVEEVMALQTDSEDSDEDSEIGVPIDMMTNSLNVNGSLSSGSNLGGYSNLISSARNFGISSIAEMPLQEMHEFAFHEMPGFTTAGLAELSSAAAPYQTDNRDYIFVPANASDAAEFEALDFEDDISEALSHESRFYYQLPAYVRLFGEAMASLNEFAESYHVYRATLKWTNTFLPNSHLTLRTVFPRATEVSDTSRELVTMSIAAAMQAAVNSLEAAAAQFGIDANSIPVPSFGNADNATGTVAEGSAAVENMGKHNIAGTPRDDNLAAGIATASLPGNGSGLNFAGPATTTFGSSTWTPTVLPPAGMPAPVDTGNEPQRAITDWLMHLILRIESLRTNWIIFQYKDDLTHDPSVLPTSGSFFCEGMEYVRGITYDEASSQMDDFVASVPHIISEYQRALGVI